MRVLLLILLILPQLAGARVFMCVDEATGKTTFTDKGCEKTSAREEVRIDATNLDSGARSTAPDADKTWNSERDERKSGLQYSSERRAMYMGRATARRN